MSDNWSDYNSSGDGPPPIAGLVVILLLMIGFLGFILYGTTP